MLNMCKIIPMSRNRVKITGTDQLDTDTLWKMHWIAKKTWSLFKGTKLLNLLKQEDYSFLGHNVVVMMVLVTSSVEEGRGFYLHPGCLAYPLHNTTIPLIKLHLSTLQPEGWAKERCGGGGAKRERKNLRCWERPAGVVEVEEGFDFSRQ